MGATIIDRLAAGKGDDAVVLQTLLVIWVQGWVSCTGPEGIGSTYTKQRRHPGVPLSGDFVVLAVATHDLKMFAASFAVKPAPSSSCANAVPRLPKATVAPNISAFNFPIMTSPFANSLTRFTSVLRSRE